MPNLTNVIKITQSKYNLLIAGQLPGYTYDPNALYLISDGKYDYVPFNFTTQGSGSYITNVAESSGTLLFTKEPIVVGNATTPIYFTGGIPVACAHSLYETVPTGAKFTDTTYTTGEGIDIVGPNRAITLQTATTGVIGGIKVGSIYSGDAEPEAILPTDNKFVLAVDASLQGIIGIPTASTGITGLVRVDSSLNSASNNPVRNSTIYSALRNYLPLSGGTVTGNLIIRGDINAENIDIHMSYVEDDLYIGGSLSDFDASPGTSGQVLTSIGNGVKWHTLSEGVSIQSTGFNIPTSSDIIVNGFYKWTIALDSATQYTPVYDFINTNKNNIISVEVNGYSLHGFNIADDCTAIWAWMPYPLEDDAYPITFNYVKEGGSSQTIEIYGNKEEAILLATIVAQPGVTWEQYFSNEGPIEIGGWEPYVLTMEYEEEISYVVMQHPTTEDISAILCTWQSDKSVRGSSLMIADNKYYLEHMGK